MSDGGDLTEALDQALNAVEEAVSRERADLTPVEVGTVTYVGQGIARVAGLPKVKAEELLRLPGDVHGMALTLDPDEVGIILLGESEQIGEDLVLARCQEIIASHDGGFTTECDPREGLVFRLRLPIVRKTDTTAEE